MKNYCKKTFLGLLAFAILFSTLTNIVPVYASEDVNNKSYTITNEIASNFRNISEIASKSYDVKDMELKDFYIELAKNEIYNKNIVIKGGIDNLNFNEINVVKSNIDGK